MSFERRTQLREAAGATFAPATIVTFTRSRIKTYERRTVVLERKSKLLQIQTDLVYCKVCLGTIGILINVNKRLFRSSIGNGQPQKLDATFSFTLNSSKDNNSLM